MRIELKYMLILLSLCQLGCGQRDPSENSQDQVPNRSIINLDRQEKIITEHLKNGAWQHEIYSVEWQEEIDKGIAKDSTIAYLWQQKAMPLFKQGKYEIGMEYLDKAVEYDRQKWLDYRAFIKCIFARSYRDAISDFEDYKNSYGYGFVMDHSYDFYLGLSYLQLNEFEIAEQYFSKDHERQLQENGEDWLHYLDLFYFAISKYEQKQYEGALGLLNKSLKLYPDFSEAQIFKADCLRRLGKLEEARIWQEIGEENGRKGNTINEDNVLYERYPYQIRWY